jgi:hypothetical protein
MSRKGIAMDTEISARTPFLKRKWDTPRVILATIADRTDKASSSIENSNYGTVVIGVPS